MGKNVTPKAKGIHYVTIKQMSYKLELLHIQLSKMSYVQIISPQKKPTKICPKATS